MGFGVIISHTTMGFEVIMSHNHVIWGYYQSHLKMRRGTGVAQSVKGPTSAQVMISWFVSLSPASGSVLTAQGLPQILSPSALSLFVLSLSLKSKH